MMRNYCGNQRSEQRKTRISARKRPVRFIIFPRTVSHKHEHRHHGATRYTRRSDFGDHLGSRDRSVDAIHSHVLHDDERRSHPRLWHRAMELFFAGDLVCNSPLCVSQNLIARWKACCVSVVSQKQQRMAARTRSWAPRRVDSLRARTQRVGLQLLALGTHAKWRSSPPAGVCHTVGREFSHWLGGLAAPPRCFSSVAPPAKWRSCAMTTRVLRCVSLGQAVGDNCLAPNQSLVHGALVC